MVFDAKVWIRTNWPTGLVHEHEVTTNTFAPKRMGCYSIAGLPSAVRMYPFVHMEKGTIRVTCLAHEHRTITPARVRNRTTRSGSESRH